MYLHFAPSWLKKSYPKRTWQGKPHTKPTLYLTFDDGPIPEITPWVLEQLATYQAKATFFCIGNNAEKNPEILKSIYEAGHCIGNHTHTHQNGYKVDVDVYVEDVLKAQKALTHLLPTPITYFRPPYGRLKNAQADKLLSQYEIVMWSVLSGDFDVDLDADTVLKKTIQHTHNGAIIVFHDSVKAFPRLERVLPAYLSHFSALGYQFLALPQD